MLKLILRRFGIMLLTMVCMSFLVFAALEGNPDSIALKARGQFSTMPSRGLGWWKKIIIFQLPVMMNQENKRFWIKAMCCMKLQ